jgi:hypothetical protein
MVRLYGKHGSSRKVREHWDDAHDENTPPSRRTISNTVTRFIETGSIDDFPRSGGLPLKTDQLQRFLFLTLFFLLFLFLLSFRDLILPLLSLLLSSHRLDIGKRITRRIPIFGIYLDLSNLSFTFFFPLHNISPLFMIKSCSSEYNFGN